MLSHTYFHSASGTFTSIDLTLSSPSLFLDFSWKVGPDPFGRDHFPILLGNDGPPSLERGQRWKLANANLDQFQHLCSTRLQQSATEDADDPMSLFTSILKNTAEETIPKTSAVPKRFNKPWFSDMCKDAIKEWNRALERFKREPPSNMCGIGSEKSMSVNDRYVTFHRDIANALADNFSHNSSSAFSICLQDKMFI